MLFHRNEDAGIATFAGGGVRKGNDQLELLEILFLCVFFYFPFIFFLSDAILGLLLTYIKGGCLLLARLPLLLQLRFVKGEGGWEGL